MKTGLLDKDIVEIPKELYEESKSEQNCTYEKENTEKYMLLKEPRSNLIIGVVWTLSFLGMAIGSLVKRDFLTAIWCTPFWLLGMIIIISYINFCVKYNDSSFIFRDSLRREYKFLFEDVEWFKDVIDYWEFKMPNKQINLTVNVEGLMEFVKKFPQDKKAS